jgi:hypothetical protein
VVCTIDKYIRDSEGDVRIREECLACGYRQINLRQQRAGVVSGNSIAADGVPTCGNTTDRCGCISRMYHYAAEAAVGGASVQTEG